MTRGDAARPLPRARECFAFADPASGQVARVPLASRGAARFERALALIAFICAIANVVAIAFVLTGPRVTGAGEERGGGRIATSAAAQPWGAPR